ncbi:helix-turn-helix domain-containing protein [Micromonospora wenchangensis]
MTEDLAIKERLVALLAYIRQALHMSQRRVALLMNTQQSAISDLEKGLTDPRLSTLQRYARALGCRLEVEVVGVSGISHELASRLLAHQGSYRHSGRSNVRISEPTSSSRRNEELRDRSIEDSSSSYFTRRPEESKPYGSQFQKVELVRSAASR